jgi:peptidoglycan endopeptidase LytE
MAVTGGGQGNPVKGELPAEESPEQEDTYTVQGGDTLAKLGARWDIPWQDLAAWNHISYPYTIFPGQSLRASPPPAEGSLRTPPSSGETYVVQRGDHLAAIARSLELDWRLLAEVNGLQPPYLLYPGNVLQLPGNADAEPLPEQDTAPDLPEIYTATHTESIFGVAYYYDLDWIALAGLNDLAFPYMLSPGQAIRLH